MASRTRTEIRNGLAYVIDVDAEARNRTLWDATPGQYRTGEATVVTVTKDSEPGTSIEQDRALDGLADDFGIVECVPMRDGSDRLVARFPLIPAEPSRLIGPHGCVRMATCSERKRAWGER